MADDQGSRPVPPRRARLVAACFGALAWLFLSVAAFFAVVARPVLGGHVRHALHALALAAGSRLLAGLYAGEFREDPDR